MPAVHYQKLPSDYLTKNPAVRNTMAERWVHDTLRRVCGQGIYRFVKAQADSYVPCLHRARPGRIPRSRRLPQPTNLHSLTSFRLPAREGLKRRTFTGRLRWAAARRGRHQTVINLSSLTSLGRGSEPERASSFEALPVDFTRSWLSARAGIKRRFFAQWLHSVTVVRPSGPQAMHLD